MGFPKISIVTPSFNQGAYIEAAIQSIQNQGYPDFEHIIIDNCSTDGTAEIAAKYPHVTFIAEPDEGQSDALNKGFSMAKGDIIGWLNADDYYLPDTFKKVVSVLSKDEVDGIYSNVHFINKEGDFTRNLNSHKVVRWLCLFHCYIPSTSFFFKRQILDIGLKIDKKMHICMDQDFFANILFSGYKLKYINDYFAAFRWHDTNKSIDTKEVQAIRYREGLTIFNRYIGTRFKLNSINLFIYEMVETGLMAYRKILKIQNSKYKLENRI